MKTNVTQLRRIQILGFQLILASFFAPVIAQTAHTVDVTSNIFTPDQLTISVGDTVIWTNSQGNHNVNGTQSSFPSNPESFGNEVGAGWTFSHIFTMPGTYDYRCDPHVGWGMFGRVVVEESVASLLTINFTGMTPHAGQEIYFALIDAATGEVIDRESEIVSENFAVELNKNMSGTSYYVDFFSDHNGNGYYDAPPTDHAWRLDFQSTTGDDSLDFVHNTNFTGYNWHNQPW